MSELKHQIFNSLAWKFTEKILNQGTQFVIQILLARLLFPSDYGVLAVLLVFINLSNVIIQSGLNTLIIQKEEIDDLDISSIFIIMLFVAVFIYLNLFVAAPYIQNYYQIMNLTIYIRILSVIILFSPLNSILYSISSRKLLFKKQAHVAFLSSLISGIFAIVLAYMDYGIWALIAQQILFNLMTLLFLWNVIKWKPSLKFSKEKAKIAFNFGWKILIGNLIQLVYQDIRSIFIAKKYSTEALGFYNRGSQIPNLLISNINGSIKSVMLPILSKNQNDYVMIKKIIRKSIQTSTYFIFPLMIILVFSAEPLIIFLLTPKWASAIFYVQIFAITYAIWPIHTANIQAIIAIGRTDVMLKMEILKTSISLVVLFTTLLFGVKEVAIGMLLTSYLSVFINVLPNSKLLNYNLKEQLKDILPNTFVSLFPIIPSFILMKIVANMYLSTLVFAISYAVIFLIFSLLTKNQTLKYVVISLGKIIKGERL